MIIWDHRRICGPSLTETSSCSAWPLHPGTWQTELHALQPEWPPVTRSRCRCSCNVTEWRRAGWIYEQDTDGTVSHITSLTSCRPYWIYACYIYSKTAYGVTGGKHEWRHTSTPRKCPCRASGKRWTGYVILQKLIQDVSRQTDRLENHYSIISHDNAEPQGKRNVVTRRMITFTLRPPLSGHNELL